MRPRIRSLICWRFALGPDRECRTLCPWRAGLHDALLHQQRYSFLQLRVVASTPCRWLEVHLDVRCDTEILDRILAFGRVDGDARRGHGSAVHELRIATNAHESAPRALAHELADLEAAEEPRQLVT